MDKLQEIRDALAGTTAGEWDNFYDDANRDRVVHIKDGWDHAEVMTCADIDFILAAHNDYVPWCIIEIQRLRDLLGSTDTARAKRR